MSAKSKTASLSALALALVNTGVLNCDLNEAEKHAKPLLKYLKNLGWCTELRVLAEHAEMKAILLAISKNVDFYNRVTSSTMDEQIAVGTDHTDRIMYGVRIAAEYCKNNFKTQQK